LSGNNPRHAGCDIHVAEQQHPVRSLAAGGSKGPR
jgi:hypothetical protein